MSLRALVASSTWD